jgi:hypothetical protein
MGYFGELSYYIAPADLHAWLAIAESIGLAEVRTKTAESRGTVIHYSLWGADLFVLFSAGRYPSQAADKLRKPGDNLLIVCEQSSGQGALLDRSLTASGAVKVNGADGCCYYRVMPERLSAAAVEQLQRRCSRFVEHGRAVTAHYHYSGQNHKIVFTAESANFIELTVFIDHCVRQGRLTSALCIDSKNKELTAEVRAVIDAFAPNPTEDE